MDESTLLHRRPGQRSIDHATSKNSHGQEVKAKDARWDQVFREKFADPEYYGSRLLPHSSPKVDP
jgi:hypothetical protein